MKACHRTMLEERLPSRRDIRDACRQIQSDWSESERRKRAGLVRESPWLPPMIRITQLGFDGEVEVEA